MPLLHVRSLPLPPGFDAEAAVRAVSAAFAAGAGVDERHVTVTWQVLAPGHYSFAGATAATQPADSHPVLVDLLAPDVNGPERVAAMLESAAAAVARAAGVPEANVFVDFRAARSGAVYDAGAIVTW